MIQLGKSLWRHRGLIVELSRREIFQGHANHILGGVWVFANPLITLAVYFLVFHFIFPSRLPGGGAAEVFLIAGLVQWIVLSESLVKSSSIVRSNANLVKQINFPIETLVAKSVLASLFVQAIMSLGLLAIIVIFGNGIGIAGLLLWITALILQAIFMLGMALLLSAVTPFVPDISEIVGVIARLGLFITPILYTADQFGPTVRALFHLNPFSYLAWIHQQAAFEQMIGYPVAWLGAAFLAIGVLWAGERAFKLMSPAFNDVL